MLFKNHQFEGDALCSCFMCDASNQLLQLAKNVRLTKLMANHRRNSGCLGSTFFTNLQHRFVKTFEALKGLQLIKIHMLCMLSFVRK